MKKLIALSIIASVSMATFAGDILADKKVAKAAPAFNTIDLDSDGYISMKEAKSIPNLSEAFEKLDEDKDKKLNREEYREFLKASR